MHTTFHKKYRECKRNTSIRIRASKYRHVRWRRDQFHLSEQYLSDAVKSTTLCICSEFFQLRTNNNNNNNNNNIAVELSLLLRNEEAKVQVSVPGLAGLTWMLNSFCRSTLLFQSRPRSIRSPTLSNEVSIKYAATEHYVVLTAATYTEYSSHSPRHMPHATQGRTAACPKACNSHLLFVISS